MDIKALDPQQWYNAIKDAIKDICSLSFREETHRFEKYEELYKAIRIIHFDYVGFFYRFINDTYAESGYSLLDAKSKLLRAREEHAARRALVKQDALSFVRSATNEVDKRYLFSVAWYFHYLNTRGYSGISANLIDIQIYLLESDRNGGDGVWDSASSAFWYAVDGVDYPEECRRITKEFLDSLNSRYLSISENFTSLELFYKYNIPPHEGLWTQLQASKKGAAEIGSA